MNNQEEYISLYDYQGRKDDVGLGLNLYKYAISAGIKPGRRIIENKKYKGTVKTYPRYIIESFFKSNFIQ